MTSRSRRRSSADAAYRLLLRIYPRSYRERFAGQMRETFLAELDQARGADSWRLIPFWLVTAIQAVWFGIRERLAARAAARLEPTPPRLGPGLVAGLKLLRAPRELPAIVVALAVGVGLTAAAYSLIHAVLLTPLPYRDPDTLVQVWRPDDVLGSRRNLSDRSREALAAAPSPFVSVASYGTVREPLMRADSGGAAITAAGALVTGSAFDVLGVPAATGRTLRPEDARLTASPPIVVSETLVRTGVLEGRIGERVDLGGVTYRLVGTMPEGFWFPDRASVFWIPILDVPPELRGTATFTITRPTIARLAPGVTAAIAEARSRARLESADTSRRAPEVQVASYGRLLTGSVRPSLLALQGASTLVLLLVCVNVSWLYGARARRLSSSYATMRALGATTGHLTCAHLVSAFGVAVVAAPLAVLLAWALLHAGMTLESGVFSRTAEPAITRHVVGVACLTTLAASFASSLPSIATVARTRALRGQTVRRRAGERWGIGAQVALVFALGGQAVFVALVLASLFRTNVGLPRTDYLVAILEARGPVVADPRVQLARFSSLLDRLELRGIRAAASTLFPFTRYDNGSTFERARSRDQERASVRVRAVTPGYFQLTGQIATQGRLLAEQDAGARRIVVNDVFQAAVLHGREVLGAATGGDNQWTIVGVTKAVRQATVDEEVRPEAVHLV